VPDYFFKLISERTRSSLDPAQLLAIDDHIRSCRYCQKLLAERSIDPSVFVNAIRAAERTDLAVDHLDFKIWRGYLKGDLDEVDRELVEGHLELCPFCRKRIDQFEQDS
jgi:hypothetical protein